MRDKKEHKELINKYYPKGYTLINFPNPTFDKNETFASFKKKYEKLMKEFFPDGLDGDMVINCAFKNPVFREISESNK